MRKGFHIPPSVISKNTLLTQCVSLLGAAEAWARDNNGQGRGKLKTLLFRFPAFGGWGTLDAWSSATAIPAAHACAGRAVPVCRSGGERKSKSEIRQVCGEAQCSQREVQVKILRGVTSKERETAVEQLTAGCRIPGALWEAWLVESAARYVCE